MKAASTWHDLLFGALVFDFTNVKWDSKNRSRFKHADKSLTSEKVTTYTYLKTELLQQTMAQTDFLCKAYLWLINKVLNKSVFIVESKHSGNRHKINSV